MKQSIFIFISILVFSSCMKGEKVDLIIHNARILTMDEQYHEYEAMAIKNGKIIELGAERQILNKYRYDESVDAMGKMILPSFTDAHGHMMSYARAKLSANLFGSINMQDLLIRCEKYSQKNNYKVIYGRGWDQTLWGMDSFPNNQELNKLFPNIPVVLFRIDGHAALVNDAALKKAEISAKTQCEGGIIEVKNGKCTGILIDNSINLIQQKMEDFPDKKIKEKLMEIQNELIQYGITEVHEAGVDAHDRDLLIQMNNEGKLLIQTYCMLFPSSDNKLWTVKKGLYKKKNLSIRSFKVLTDGALGSRGALLKKAYHDHPNHFGIRTYSDAQLNKIADFALEINYQVNFHAIGDSSNALVLNLMKKAYTSKPDHRWRIEHAQVVDPKDWYKFSQFAVIPSVQPVHATSDQAWAQKRLGDSRMAGAYAYKSLLKQAGIICYGTDFPIELPNPFLTIHAATQRKNQEGVPGQGFFSDEATSLNETIKAMTYWGAMAAFRDKEVGSLEKGKLANFTILQYQLKKTGAFEENYSWKTFVKGKCIFSAE